MSAAVPSEELLYREGGPKDMREAFDLSQLALRHIRGRMGPVPGEVPEEEIDSLWERRRPLLEFIVAQEGSFCVCEGPHGIAGFARVVRFDDMEQLTELFVHPSVHGQGNGTGQLERCWSDRPTTEVGREVVATGAPADLTLYTGFGVMPANGRLRLVERTERYVERRLRERDATEPGVHVLESDRALAEWKRMEPGVVGHQRRAMHEFFARERMCLASMDAEGRPNALCWVDPAGDIGPGVAVDGEGLVPVVLAALDRVAKAHEPEELHLPVCATSWWLLQRLRSLGFRVSWPGWILCSVPLPDLYRYVPADPGVFL